MTGAFEEKFQNELNLLSIELKNYQINQFYDYFQLLIEWNKFMNLTAITEMDEVITKHFVDSLSLVKAVKEMRTKNYRIIDVGTGAGFPGIPLKIAFPDLKITLMDSLNKRINFLNEAINRLELKEIEAIHGRAEDLGRDPLHREQYDLCLSRAVANLSTLSEYCMPFVKPGGYFIPYKSGKIEEELGAAKHAIFLLGGNVEEVKTFLLPGTEVERSLVKIVKNHGTSKKYPRKAGLPSKEPLK
ncbi:16S rRNA (guanine(527)-N(7))-methyltransferase RsmG [Lacrimispora saccharolytica]|uniref:Ribosomal RNA small subunit methyltransferase G n=1 Tax=Lacrimispora saccharolytica (strain ATCC 35040 / DSM 2544 / NRCC 2533 / WM1) TaxID=610130 RepID=D9R3R8_LACSW|nr:16S rRNA (guanine(527)-N(7))-methyltransferase RsmG [Lacrimispora saccharolytica]ADL06789.1 methyltransferase GidB [[Clostridium] saccharolyticum WM1]QRV22196.1 16S rRNA (guanine(527)-N(7))-methyltransferase RsmG [Lacrimispora saccharolytica]